jgi:predicted DNA-binding transcriptional regulator AlpA
VNRVEIGVPLASSPSCEMLTAKELEALLKIDVKTIYSYVQRGLIPYVRIQSNVRFVRQQIFDWISEHNYRPRSANGNGGKRRPQ